MNWNSLPGKGTVKQKKQRFVFVASGRLNLVNQRLQLDKIRLLLGHDDKMLREEVDEAIKSTRDLEAKMKSILKQLGQK